MHAMKSRGYKPPNHGKLGLVKGHIAKAKHISKQQSNFHAKPRNLANTPKHSLKLVTRGIIRTSPNGPTTAQKVKGSRS